MKFLLDQDLYQATIRWLIKHGHDVITAKDLNLQRAPDRKLLEKAVELERLFMTRDKDFGTLVFLRRERSQGVIRLAVNPQTVEAVHKELGKLFKNHEEEELHKSFCVVEPNRHKVRRLS